MEITFTQAAAAWIVAGILGQVVVVYTKGFRDDVTVGQAFAMSLLGPILAVPIVVMAAYMSWIHKITSIQLRDLLDHIRSKLLP
jgi:hypothetical protein